MPITQIGQQQEQSVMNRQVEDARAQEEMRAREKIEREKSEREAELNKPSSKPLLPKENLGKKLDVNA